MLCQEQRIDGESYFKPKKLSCPSSPPNSTAKKNPIKNFLSKSKDYTSEEQAPNSPKYSKTTRKLSSTSKHSLFYRLFHSSDDDTAESKATNQDIKKSEKSNLKNSSILLTASDSESDSCSTPATLGADARTPVPSSSFTESIQSDQLSALSLPPPLIPTDAVKPTLSCIPQKSSLSLANFFKREISKKEKAPEPNGFLFSHLKTNEIPGESPKPVKILSPNTIKSDPSAATSSITIMPSCQPSLSSNTLTTSAMSLEKLPSDIPNFVATKRNNSEVSLSEKYGWIEKKCIGKGANGVVRVSHKQDISFNSEKLYAIKEFKKKHKDESDKSFIKKLTSEFCIGSSLHHENVVQTIDLIKNENQQWCEVLEYCGGGDLCHVIQNKHLSCDEVNTFFLQLIHGVDYIHKMGVSHRDLKPENLVLDSKGSLKIADFGEAEVFRDPYEKTSHKSKRCCGSQPYMAPEEFTLKEFDSPPIDIFACGVIYLAMTYNRLPWRKPNMDDANFRYFCGHRKGGFAFLDRLSPGPRELLRHMLHPEPTLRATMEDILSDEWFKGIELAYSIKCQL